MCSSPTTRPALYDELIDDLAYSYDGVFSRQTVAAAVYAAKGLLEPTATVRTYLPVLVARQAREQLMSAAQSPRLTMAARFCEPSGCVRRRCSMSRHQASCASSVPVCDARISAAWCGKVSLPGTARAFSSARQASGSTGESAR